MRKESVFIKTLAVLILLNFTLHPVMAITFENKTGNDTYSMESVEDISPGEIIDISLSNQHPTLGKPIEIIITVKGNPTGQRFNETIMVSDEYEGLIVKSSEAKWKSGNVTFDQVEIKIGRLSKYTKKIQWYPVVVGNHTLKFNVGTFSEKTKNVSVGFDVENIVFPSLGCPSIVNKNITEKLTIVVSEERLISENPFEIGHAELKKIDGSSTYILDNQSIQFSTWLYISEDEVEDELIVSYNISSIPYGFYNITITTEKEEYTWPHAVKIIDEEPEEFSFVQLTDLHIGKVYNLINEKEMLADVIHYVNEEVKPDFVVLSGDLVDWYNSRNKRNFFLELQEIIVMCDSPVFTIPGNHDRYEHRLLLLYNPFYDLSNYHFYINPLNDYAFEYGNMNFLLLDSGYDYSRWEIKLNIWSPTPEGSGLTDTQIYLIENELGNDEINQNIIMHHPAVNEIDDYGLFSVPDDLPSGNDECIAFNREKFIEYCLASNVSLVLAGHTHNNKILDFLGEEPVDPFEWPMFVQTDSTTLNRKNVGGRLVDVEDGQVQSYEYVPLTYK
jgi:predicted MPP superfamily phosphohydrolase